MSESQGTDLKTWVKLAKDAKHSDASRRFKKRHQGRKSGICQQLENVFSVQKTIQARIEQLVGLT